MMDRKSTSDEIDSPGPVNDDSAASTAVGTSRSYDCMYCKRGFSTAQALGGHMNIHRRDRARVREPPAAAPPARPAEPETFFGYVHGAAAERSTASTHATCRPLFPLVSHGAPYGHRQRNTSDPSPADHAFATEIRRQQAQGRDEVDPEKMKELRRYGRELELGRNRRVDRNEEKDDDEEGAKDRVDLKLAL